VIFQMIYTCALEQGVKSDELESIAQTSRVRNLARGVTGILLCKEGSVLQVLEGEKEIVKSLFRHSEETGSAFELTSKSFPTHFPHDVSPETTTITRTFARVNGLT